MATGPVAGTAAQGPGLTGVWEVALGLLLVLGAILALAWLMKRLYPGVGGGGTHLRVVAALALGPRERLLIVDAAGKQLLLGVTAQQVTALHAFDAPPLPAPPAAGADFALRLREVLGTGTRA